MKHFIITAIVMLFVAIPMTAQKHETKSDLVGMWQLCSFEEHEGKVEMQFQPYIKKLDSDGQFRIIYLRTSDSGSLMTTCGSYRIINDSCYVEHIDKSISDSILIGKDNQLEYKLGRGGWLVITYPLQNGQKAKEVWRKIGMRHGQGDRAHGIRNSNTRKAQYPGGFEALVADLKENLSYPETQKSKGVQGLALVRFVVNEDGQVSNVEIDKTSGVPEMDEAAKDVIFKLKKFIPAETKEGKKIKCNMSIPVRFSLDKNIE